MYVTRPGEKQLPTGEFLGDLTNELEKYGPGAHIDEFVSAGPKNYSFTVATDENQDTSDRHLVCKAKGFTLNAHNSQLINFQAMKELVHDYVQKGKRTKVKIHERRIARLEDHRVVTREMLKTYQVVYDKRFLHSDFTTTPWGFIEPQKEDSKDDY